MDRPDARVPRRWGTDAVAPGVDDESDPDGSEASDDAGPEASAWDDRLPSNVVALAIARREHVVVGELPPLFGSVDTDALDALVRATPRSVVSFTHLGYEVTVTGDGEVELTPVEEP